MLTSKDFCDSKREVTVDAEVKNGAIVTGMAEEYLSEKNVNFKIVSQVCIAIDEIYSNIANYAYKDHNGKITVVLDVDSNNVLRLLFEDSGIPFNPLEKSDPDINLSVEERGIGGLGIFIVKQTMDEVEYAYQNNQNLLLLTKKL